MIYRNEINTLLDIIQNFGKKKNLGINFVFFSILTRYNQSHLVIRTE